MIQLVKGNDAPIEWRVSLNGQPLDLTGKAVTLYVINSRGPFQLKDFKVEGHVVTCTYYGADQTRFGAHSLILRLNEGLPEMSTVAVKDVLELVEWSKEQGGENGGPVKVTPIILEADVAVGHSGGDIDLSDYLTKEEFNEVSERFASADRVQELSENVTELSAEVSGLSERVDNLPSAEDEVFEAIYGETTYDEIVEARNAGKMVICVYNQLIYILIRLTDERANFSVTEGNFLYQVICPKGGSWLRDNVNLSHKLEVLADNKVKVTIGGNSSEVATPQYVENAIQQSGGGGSKEWKCVFDGRMEVGEQNLEFTTYADGTPLKAKELIVQVVIDANGTQNMQGYVKVQSTTNKTLSSYGAIYFEKSDIGDTPQLSQVRMMASPMYMVADIIDCAKALIAQGTQHMARIGNVKPAQIYEDITYVLVQPNGPILSAAPLVKVYAR